MEKILFTQKVNQEQDIIAVADGYKTKIGHDLWLADGLQKDGIQNCWDARNDKKGGKGWECGFSLINHDNKTLLCIEDRGTTGLNGTIFYTEPELTKILHKISVGKQRVEDLACFLNSNWSSKSTEEGGNRGRGKTLFLVASKDKKIFFESLRSSDGSYVFGEYYLDTDDKQVKFRLHYDNDGRVMLGSEFNGKIKPISWHGTRIFITEPDEAIVKSIKDGKLLEFIGNSRWETIKKYKARIFVDDGIKKRYATLPSWYEDDLDKVEEVVYPAEIIKDGTDYKTQKLVLRYAPNLKLPDDIKGIAIQRDGMTIERIPTDDLMHEQGASDIYGWLELEKGSTLETELKFYCEGPEHFNFSWALRPAKPLRDYLRTKVREFAKQLLLIEPEEARKNKIQKTAEEQALKSLASLFKNLGLSGKHRGKKKKKKTKRKPNEPLRLSATDMIFPREEKRVNYGEAIKNLYAVPINELKSGILVFVRVFIQSDDGKIEILEEQKIKLGHGAGKKIGVDNFVISDKHRKGGYSFKAEMTALEDSNIILANGKRIEKADILYKLNIKFYVEVDPPDYGPVSFRADGRDDKNYLFGWEADDNGYIILYNDKHPRIEVFKDDVEKLGGYLTEFGALVALQIKLEDIIADNSKEDPDYNRLIKSKDLTKVLPVHLRKYSEFLWDLLK